MTITADLLSLTPGTRIELFVLDATAIPGGSLSYWHDGKNSAASIVWQGTTYDPWPIMVEGYEASTKGELPRPTLSISNVTGAIGLLVRDLEDLVGARLTRKRTMAKYLDGMPGADPAQELEEDVFLIERKLSETKDLVTFELASPLDAQGLRVPSRLIQATICPWNDAAICTYSVGGVCDKTIAGATGCKFHWGATADLPFGGFPGAGRIR